MKPNTLLLIILALCAPLFFLGGPDYWSAPLYRALWDSGHWLFFALLGLLIQRRVPLCTPKRWLLAFTWVAILGGSIEVIQALLGRDMSALDWLHDLAGFGFGALLVCANKPAIWLARFAVLLLVLPLGWQLLLSAQLQWLHYRQFPVIADFESASELIGVTAQANLQSEQVFHGERALAFRLGPTPYSGVSISRLLGDWRGYQFLAFELYNPSPKPLRLTLRIADKIHSKTSNRYEDRFNQSLWVHTGWNHFRVAIAHIENAPRGRSMNMSQITDITLFTATEVAPQILVLDYVRLN